MSRLYLAPARVQALGYLGYISAISRLYLAPARVQAEWVVAPREALQLVVVVALGRLLQEGELQHLVQHLCARP